MRSKTAVLLIIFSGLLVFVNSLNNNFIGDDIDQIVDNPLVHSVKNIPALFTGSTYFRGETQESYGLFYRPLMLSMYSVLYHFWNVDPLPYHLLQLVFHICNAILVFLILGKFFKNYFPLIGATVFLVHPVNSETVVYIAHLQEVLFMFFGLLAVYLMIRKDRIVKGGFLSYFITAILLLFSLFSKETGLLFICTGIVYCVLNARKKLKLFIASSVTAAAVYLFFRITLAGSKIVDIELTPIGELDFGHRLINIPMIIIRYLYLFVFPKDLSLNEVWIVRSVRNWEFLMPLIIVFTLVFIWYRCYKLLEKGKTSRISGYLFFSLWAFMGMAVHFQLIPLDATLALRWFYFPMIGIIGIIGIIGEKAIKDYPVIRKTAFVFSGVLLLVFSARTVIRNFDWVDAYTLFSRDIKTSGGNYYLENSLGSLYITDGKYNLAAPLIESSIRQFPYFGNLNNMAMIYVHEKKLEQADEYFKKALQKHGNYMVYQNYANFLMYIKKDKETAGKFAGEALEIYPRSEKLKLVLDYSIR